MFTTHRVAGNRIILFHEDTTGEAYDETQTSDEITNGDILIVAKERVVGIMCKAWPVALTEQTGEFHAPEPIINILPALSQEFEIPLGTLVVAQQLAKVFDDLPVVAS